MRLEGKIYGLKEVKAMYAIAPKKYLSMVRHWFYSERKRYVGNKSKDGTFRQQVRKLMHGGKNEFRRPGRWPKNVVRSIKGYVFGIESMKDITLSMGMKADNNFMRGMAMMDEGYAGSRTINSGGAMMTIPVYRNLRGIGITKNFELSRKMLFSKEGGMFARRLNSGTVLFFRSDDSFKTGANKGKVKRSALLFIGKRQVKLKPHFDFVNQWERGIGAVVSRGQTRVDRTTRDLQKGYLTAE